MTPDNLSIEQQKRLEARRQREARETTPEEVIRRNFVERIKRDRAPYDLEGDFGRLSEAAYEAVPEEDILRLQWFGLYHDKPKLGYFMMRIKIPNGILTAVKLRTIGQLAIKFGSNRGELTTRQDIQLHAIQLKAIPEIFQTLAKAGLSTKGGCGDVLRNITGCPVAGVDAAELFDATPLVMEAHRRVSGNPAYGDLPRKHKWTISTCPHHCNAPEIHDVALVGAIQDGRQGFAVWVGGGLSILPRIAKPLGVFVTAEEGLETLIAIMEVWRVDLRYRMSRAKARFKFMVDDYGPEKIRELVEAKLGRRLADLRENPRPIGRTDHMGAHRQKQPGLFYVGFPVFPGLLTGDQMVKIAGLLESFGGDARVTREQNLVVTGIPETRLEGLLQEFESEAGLTLKVNAARGRSIGCTGDPFCNFSVGETKMKLVEVVEHLEKQFGDSIADLHFHLDGCPHACGQHWVGDIGMQGTTLTGPGGKVQAYDILLRGGLGPHAAIGKAILRRVATQDLRFYVERLVRSYLESRQSGEAIQQFFNRKTDDELRAIAAGGTPAAAAEPAAVV